MYKFLLFLPEIITVLCVIAAGYAIVELLPYLQQY